MKYNILIILPMLFFSFQFLYFLLCHLKMNHVYQQVEQQDQGKKIIMDPNSGQMSTFDFHKPKCRHF